MSRPLRRSVVFTRTVRHCTLSTLAVAVLLTTPARAEPAPGSEEESALLELQQIDAHPERVAQASLSAAHLYYEVAMNPASNDAARAKAGREALAEFDLFLTKHSTSELAPMVHMQAASCADSLGLTELMKHHLDAVRQSPIASTQRDVADFWYVERYLCRDDMAAELRPEARAVLTRIEKESPSLPNHAFAMARHVILSTLDSEFEECADVGDRLLSLLEAHPEIHKPLEVVTQLFLCRGQLGARKEPGVAAKEMVAFLHRAQGIGFPLKTGVEVVTSQFDELDRKLHAAEVLGLLAESTAGTDDSYGYLSKQIAFLSDADAPTLKDVLAGAGRHPFSAKVAPAVVDAFLSEMHRIWEDRAKTELNQEARKKGHKSEAVAELVLGCMRKMAPHADLTYETRLEHAEAYEPTAPAASKAAYAELVNDEAAPAETRLGAAKHVLADDATRCEHTDVLSRALDAARRVHRHEAEAQAQRELAICAAGASHLDEAVQHLRDGLSVLGVSTCTAPGAGLPTDLCYYLDRYSEARNIAQGTANELRAVVERLRTRPHFCDLAFDAAYRWGKSLQSDPKAHATFVSALEQALQLGRSCPDLRDVNPKQMRDALFTISVELADAYLAVGAVDRVPGVLAAFAGSASVDQTVEERLRVAHQLIVSGALSQASVLLKAVEPGHDQLGLYALAIDELLAQATAAPGPADGLARAVAVRLAKPRPASVLMRLAKLEQARGNERAARAWRKEILSGVPEAGVVADHRAYLEAVFDERIDPLTEEWPGGGDTEDTFTRDDVVDAYRRLSATDPALQVALGQAEALAQRLDVGGVLFQREAAILDRRILGLHYLAGMARHLKRPRGWTDEAWEMNRSEAEEKLSQPTESRAADFAEQVRRLRSKVTGIALADGPSGPLPADVWPPSELPPLFEAQTSAQANPDAEDARRRASDALTASANDEVARSALVTALMRLHLSMAAKVVALPSPRLTARLMLADGRPDLARAALDKETDAGARADLAWLNLGLQSWVKAQELATLATKQEPGNRSAALASAEASLGAGDFDTAEARLATLATGADWIGTRAQYLVGVDGEFGPRSDDRRADAAYTAFIKTAKDMPGGHPVFMRRWNLPQTPAPGAQAVR